EELGIAFEHNGTLHYENRGQFKHDLERVQSNDLQKQNLCQLNNVKLIVIEALNYKTKIEDLKNTIKQKCINQNIQLPASFNQITIDHNK
ncbi:hypothetical protein ACI3PL_22460, partial [Lacticaseibacillus paracasei]